MTTPVPLSALPEEKEAELVSSRIEMMTNAIQADREKEIMADFQQRKTDRDKFAYVWGLPSVHVVMDLQEEYHGKSRQMAAFFRADGNKYFQKKSYISAIDSYNKALRHADTVIQDGDTPDDNHLALSYANRSAAMLHLGRYKEALTDIELALEASYPQAAAYKLHDRRAKCYKGLGDKQKALESFQQALNDVKSCTDLNEQMRTMWSTAITKEIAACQAMADVPNGTSESEDQQSSIRMAEDPNEQYPRLSLACQVECNKKKGRHVKAAQNIKVGDVVVVDEPYASVLFQAQQAEHCYNCLSRLTCPVPCTGCSSISFCSPNCRTIAWESFHRYECRFYALFDTLLLARIGHLALRIIMKTGLKQLLDFYEKNKSETNGEHNEEQNGSVNGHTPFCGSFGDAYQLEGHADDHFPLQEFNFCVLSAFLVKILLVSGFFQTDGEDLGSSTENIEAIGSFILHYLHVIQCNSYRIEKLQPGCRFDDIKPYLLGVALYPSVSMINHSCDPNIDINFVGDKAVVRAVRNIYEGEEITLSYGPTFYDTEVKVRQQHLLYTYYFKCECEACQEYWPTVKTLADCMIAFRCEQCRTPLDMSENPHKRLVSCSECQHQQDVQEMIGKLEQSHETFASAMTDAFGGRYAQAVDKLKAHMTLMQRYLCQPWRDFTSCQACLKHCYRLME